MADEKSPAARPAPKAEPKAAAESKPEPKPEPEPKKAERRAKPAHTEAAAALRDLGGVTDAMADELAAAGVNPKLDNRIGDQRPATHARPKPQQVSADV